MKRLAYVIAAGVLAVLAAWILVLVTPRPGNRAEQLNVSITQAMIDRGAYLARAGDCTACHSKPTGEPFAGGIAIHSPIGGMTPPNITPDPQYGIGAYSYGDFVRAVRYGVRKDGAWLYPAMPWTSYAKIAESDMQALYAYFMKGVKPVAKPSDANTIPWPLSIRWPMTYWAWMFGPTVNPPATPPNAGIELGRYFVEGLGHCGACHTPRALTMQEKVIDAASGNDYLAGGQVIDGYATPSLRGEWATGLGRVTQQQIVEVLKTGVAGRHATFGGMSQVVSDSLQYMTDADLDAMAQFLKSLPAKRAEDATHYDMATFKELSAKTYTKPGAKLYAENCSGCHLMNGMGYRTGYPALALNPATVNTDPSALVQIVLAGGKLADIRQSRLPPYFMPAFANKLSDQEVADILTFVRQSWGNRAGAVAASHVAGARKNLPRSPQSQTVAMEPKP